MIKGTYPFDPIAADNEVIYNTDDLEGVTGPIQVPRLSGKFYLVNQGNTLQLLARNIRKDILKTFGR